MAQNEETLWEILGLLYGSTSGWSSDIRGDKQVVKIKNGHSVSALKGKLVLKFLPEDIKDTIYFMKHRNYLATHGNRMMMSEAVYSLSDKAISVYESKKLPSDEEEAFKDSLWSIEPKLYGMGPNMKGWKKLLKKWFS